MREQTKLAERVARLAISDPLVTQPGPSSASTPPEPSAARVVLAETEQSIHAVISEAMNIRRPQIGRQEQSARVLESLGPRIKSAIALLRRADPKSEEPAVLWAKVDDVQRELAIVAESLKYHKDTPEKANVVEQMRELESELTAFTATLPDDKRPLYYDSGMRMDFVNYSKGLLPFSIRFG